MSELSDEGLRDELLKHGVDVGPIVGEFSCRSEGVGATPVSGCYPTASFAQKHQG